MLPTQYADTPAMQAMRACERFKMDPREFGRMTAGEQAVLLAYDRLRSAEESRRDAVLAGGVRR